MSTILITGGSGFLGSHCIVAALKAGHEVRTTLRTPGKESQVRTLLDTAGVNPGNRLSVHLADLQRDEDWADAAAGCDYVIHTASPFPLAQPDDPDDLIVPARDGALRALWAARDAGVKRVVLTSSFAAVGYGGQPARHVHTEEDWTPADAPNAPYIQSKTIAERAAWNFAREKGAPELSVINPTGIFGPVLGPHLSTSIQIIKSLLDGAYPDELPDMWFGVVDVRDVAELHLRAMTDPAACGERFIAVSGEPVSLLDVAILLRERLGARAVRVPKRGASPSAGSTCRRASSEKAKRRLGWTPRPSSEAIIASAESLDRLGLNRLAQSRLASAQGSLDRRKWFCGIDDARSAQARQADQDGGRDPAHAGVPSYFSRISSCRRGRRSESRCGSSTFRRAGHAVRRGDSDGSNWARTGANHP